jgi:endonuclease/exonuclease/phosphatase family metal-dependent hydrolase
MNHTFRSEEQRAAAWDFLAALEADYALLQEAVPPPGVPREDIVGREGGIGESRQWGSLVVSFRGPLKEIREAASVHHRTPMDLLQAWPGSVAIAETADGLTLISMYGLMENAYALTTVHRQLSDLTPLFDRSPRPRVVLAGDLNLSSQLEEPDRARHRNALQRFETLGLVDALSLERPPRPRLADCPCSDEPCRHVRTHVHSQSTKPWQDDYVFVSHSLETSVAACRAVDSGSPDPWSLSDHCPLLLDLDLEQG